MTRDLEIERVLERYRPAGPPPELRARIVASAARPRARTVRWRDWTPVAAAVAFTVLFYWLGARQRGDLEARLAPPAAPGVVAVIDVPPAEELQR